METRERILKSAVLTLIVLLLILSGLFIAVKNIGQKNLATERLNSETLISEKLKLDKNIAQLKNALKQSIASNDQLNSQFNELQKQLGAKENEINQLSNSNKLNSKIIKDKNSEIENLKNQFNNEIEKLNLVIKEDQIENKTLNHQIEALESEKARLANDNAILEAMAANNYLTEAQKKRNAKITVLARRTNALLVSFDLPYNNTENIYFTINTPEGEEISSKNNSSANVISVPNKNLTASLNGTGQTSVTFRTELKYTPDKKLKRGIYKFNIYNNDKYLGSSQIKLR
jgi:DNA repair exonuclease SbcCD ATPase subunit